jgi:hypothetical protein
MTAKSFEHLFSFSGSNKAGMQNIDKERQVFYFNFMIAYYSLQYRKVENHL